MLSMQLIVGTWQLLSSLISVGLLKLVCTNSRRYTSSYQGFIFRFLLIIPFPEKLSRSTASLIILMVPAWTLAVYYYAITFVYVHLSTRNLQSKQLSTTHQLLNFQTYEDAKKARDHLR